MLLLLSIVLLLPGNPAPPMATSLPPSCFLWTLFLLWRIEHRVHGPNTLSADERVDKKLIKCHACGSPAVLPTRKILLAM